MHHEMMRRHAQPSTTDTVGDVLASIRQLIAQDEAGGGIRKPALDVLAIRDDAAHAGIGPVFSKSFSSPATPLVLGNADMVGPLGGCSDASITGTAATRPAVRKAPGRMAGTEAAAEFRQRDFGTWPGPGLKEPDRPDLTGAGPQPTAPITVATPSRTDADHFIGRSFTNANKEQAMLHANATVTPFNPLAEAHAAAEALSRESEQHLFAQQERDAQKGSQLRGMIREAIRQELQGEIGNRLSRNLQQMIRQEVELALRQMCEDK
jgi:hypothetical protein